MHRALTLSLFLLITLVATAQSGSPVTYLNPGEVFHPPGYSAAVVVTAAKLVYVSGQVALNSRGDLVGKGILPAKSRKFSRIFRLC